MFRVPVLLLTGLIAVAISASAPGAAATGRTLVFSGSVRELAADGPNAAMLLGSSQSCSVLLWNARTGRQTRIHDAGCAGSPRDGTHTIAEAAGRAAWIQTDGGNTLETNLRTATSAKPKPIELAFEGADPDAEGTYVGEVRGDGSRFFFRTWDTCSTFEGTGSPCPDGLDSGAVVRSHIWVYAPQGAGKCPNDSRTPPRGCRELLDASGEVRVLTADAGRVAIRLPGGGIELLSTSGVVLQTFAVASGNVQAALSGNRLAVLQGGAVTVYDTGTGAVGPVWPAPTGARLVNAAAGRALLLNGHTFYLLRLTDGRAVSGKVPGTGRVAAALSGSGLFYSYTAQRGQPRGRVRLVPLTALPR